MPNSRLSAIIRKEFIQLFRDRRMLALILVIPIMQLFLLGYAATNDVRDVPVAVFDQSHSAPARALLDAFSTTDYFSFTRFVDSYQQIEALIANGDVSLGLVIPPNYADQLLDGQAQVALIIDGSDPSVATTALSAAQLISLNHSTKVMAARLAQTGLNLELKPSLELRTTVWYNPDLVSSHFMIPGVIGMILFAITAILTASAVVKERERGTIEQLIVTPIRPAELLIGKLTPYVLVSLFDAFEVIAVGHWWFGMPVRGSLLLIALVSLLFLFSGLGIGLLASTIANTQQEAMLTVWMTLLPALFLSGFFFPLSSMPLFLQWISYLMPLRYYLIIIRYLLVKGVGFASIQTEVIALILFGVGIMTIASLRFRKRLD